MSTPMRLLTRRHVRGMRCFAMRGVDALVQGVIDGDRLALSRSVTLLESTLPKHNLQAQDLLSRLLQHRRKLGFTDADTFRIGISGPPGAGKSTFIEALGTYLLEHDKNTNVAVLAVDPSSARTGGSILGDKTRMPNLAVHPRCFVRPSPTRGTLGGLANATSETISLCEAAGNDIVIVETVGVGQSEVAVADAVDMMILLLPPAAGDELQGIKKGVVECADLVVVNKADGQLLPAARHTKTDYARALHLLVPQSANWTPTAMLCTSIGDGSQEAVGKVWQRMCKFREATAAEHSERRRLQRAHLTRQILHTRIAELIDNSSGVIGTEATELSKQVSRNEISPREAAERILAHVHIE
ncbi:MAG: hypothetical protein MHM6MM_003760 [Cercozoa sp. M6MM]